VRRERLTPSGIAVIGLGISVSLDELAIGFGAGSYTLRFPGRSCSYAAQALPMGVDQSGGFVRLVVESLAGEHLKAPRSCQAALAIPIQTGGRAVRDAPQLMDLLERFA
jgi:hypothetical protein